MCVKHWLGNLKENHCHWRLGVQKEDNTKVDSMDIVFEDVDWILLTQDGDSLRAMNSVIKFRVQLKGGEFIL